MERDLIGNVIPDSQTLRNASVNKASQALRKELVRIKPEYGDALDAASDYIGARNMFGNLKGKLFNGGFGNADLTTALDGASPFEAQAARSAALGDIYNKAQAGQLTPRLLSLPHV